MNAHRIAQALRELADAFDDTSEAAELAPAAPKRRRQRERTIPAPSEPVDDLARARVAKTLREKGWENE